MTFAVLIAAFLLALAGGAHCAGMCGGIVGALSLSSGARDRPLVFTLAYHAGRATSYVTAGAIVGAVGQAGMALRGTLATQHTLFAIASVGLLGAGLYLAGYAPFVARVEAAGALLWRRIAPMSRGLLPVTTPGRAAVLGTLWGWLPCGMVYGALLLALGTASVLGGMLTMAAFTLGTLPSLLAVGFFARSADGRRARPAVRRLAGGAIAAVGIYGLVQLGLHAAALHDLCLPW